MHQALLFSCLLTSWAWLRLNLSGEQQLWSMCSFLVPQMPLSCVRAEALQLQGEAKPHPILSPVQASQAIEQGHESPFQEQHSGGHWSSQSSILLLDQSLGFGCAPVAQKTLIPAPLSLPKFFRSLCWSLHSPQSLNAVPSCRGVSLLKSQLLVTQCHVRVCSMTFPVAFLSCLDSHLGGSPRMYLLVHSPPVALA